ncbi:MAG: O-antigen ligase family protein [Bacteroidales bacterium]|nr:O-antigen ligase family protein [Bacteroidales bacterium]
MLKIADKYKYYLAVFAFIALNTFMMLKGFMYFNYLSVLLVLIFIAFVRLDIFLLSVVFLTPLSIPLRELFPGLSFDMWLPTEPLLVGMVLIFILKLIKGERPDRSVLMHPVSLAIYLSLFWILFTTISSTMFVVSLKFLIARLWFIIPFYIIAAQIFKNHDNQKKYVWCYLVGLLLVIAYTLGRHIPVGLMNQRAAHSVMNPFYTDHTSYGAILAMMIPVVAGFVLNSSYRKPIRIASVIIFSLLCFALLFSYTRAAWLSLMAALGVMVILVFKIRFTTVALLGGIAITVLILNLDNISNRIEKNRHQSSSDLKKHIQSMSNVSTDASNLERINRWSCAMRMFTEKPLLGWGPGTYMFQYAPFQVTREKTEISTNAADRGNAHSEYLGPLSESGAPGMLTFLLIVALTLYTGIRAYTNAPGRNGKIFAASIILGLVTYYVHGILNNFLDTDKAAAPFWGYTAMLVAMDIAYRKKNKEKTI